MSLPSIRNPDSMCMNEKCLQPACSVIGSVFSCWNVCFLAMQKHSSGKCSDLTSSEFPSFFFFFFKHVAKNTFTTRHINALYIPVHLIILILLTVSEHLDPICNSSTNLLDSSLTQPVQDFTEGFFLVIGKWSALI